MPSARSYTAQQSYNTNRPRRGFVPSNASWAQLALHTALILLLLTPRHAGARPAAVTSDLASARADGDEWSWRPVAPGVDQGGLDLRSLCEHTRSVEMRVLCRLTQHRVTVATLLDEKWLEEEQESDRKKPVSKRSDGSSLSAFQRFVSQLRIASATRSDAMQTLHQLKAMGVIDENNQVVRVPDETRDLMEQIG